MIKLKCTGGHTIVEEEILSSWCSKVAREERARGCLVGLALGDALGFPLEGLSQGRIARRFGRLDHFAFLGSRGYVSDDTELSVLLGEALLAGCGEPETSAREFGKRLVGWFRWGPPGIGMATLRASLSLMVGRPGGVASAGNGAAMRAAPLGLYSAADRPGLVRALSTVTHTDPRAVDGALVVAEAVALLVQGREADWPTLSQSLPGIDLRLREALDQAWKLVRFEASPELRAQRLGCSGYVLHSVPLALAALWSRPATFLEGLQAVVLRGGDADSNGAIAGALLGAAFGREGLPAQLVQALEPAFSAPRLEALADDLVEGRLTRYQPASFGSLRRHELAVKLGVGLHLLRRLWPL